MNSNARVLVSIPSADVAQVVVNGDRVEIRTPNGGAVRMSRNLYERTGGAILAPDVADAVTGLAVGNFR